MRAVTNHLAGPVQAQTRSVLDLPRKRPGSGLAAANFLETNTFGVMEVARRYRLRIPEDLAVVGFDDIPAAKMSTPQLTTVHQPFDEKGSD
jgi:DNA-binding LacI/PurR family transcriptional regulator